MTRCWECHKPAVGVCLGPHDYGRLSHNKARQRRNVEDSPAYLTYEGAHFDQQAPGSTASLLNKSGSG